MVDAREAAHPLPRHQPPPPHHPAPPSASAQGPPDEYLLTEDQVEIDADPPMAAHISHLRALGSAPADDDTWQDFCNTMEQITLEIQDRVKLPAPTEQHRPVRESQINDCAYIQRLYRRNRRRAVRLILEGEKPRCALDMNQVLAHFTHTWQHREYDDSVYPQVEGRQPLDHIRFTVAEVSRKLRKCENTAPGDDRLSYQHWRSVDPEGLLLAAAFNVCARHRRVPTTWKNSHTVLIHKKGDTNNTANYRPISLLRTVAKLYTGLLTSKLSSWIARHGALSPSQKGFMPFDGVYEHQYALSRYIERAKRTKTDLCVAWLDMENAFCSIPHSALPTALLKAGAGEEIATIVADLYTDCTATIRTTEGTTPRIKIEAGVRQGCPLSGILFNLAIDPLLRQQDENRGTLEHSTLAYADDLCILGSNPDELQRRLDAVTALARRLSLTFNAEKCKTMHLQGETPAGCQNTTFTVEDSEVPTLADHESATFLGKQFGYRILTNQATLAEYMRVGEKLLSSSLAPWQRIDAIKTFLFPATQFALRTATLTKGEWARLDDYLRPLIKRTINVPTRASNEYLYGARKKGCLGIPVTSEDSDTLSIDGAFKLLTSPDQATRTLAAQDLIITVRDRLGRQPTHRDLEQFLDASQEDDFKTTTNRYANTWTKARTASRHVNCTWGLDPDVKITVNGKTWYERHRTSICSNLRLEQRERRTAILHAAPHQGKVLEVVALSRASSHFMTTGSFTRFADWRFLHRARLGLVPLNAYSFSSETTTCRRCNAHPETLPHVLNHCPAHNRAILARHNAVVARIKTAATRWMKGVTENREVVEGIHIRPDLLLIKKRTAYIVDVTIVFENRQAAFAEARARKEETYTKVKKSLMQTYDAVETVPFIIGSLGSWDPNNERFLSQLCTRTYARLFRHPCVSDTIRWSRDIYVEHLTGERQYGHIVAVQPEDEHELEIP